jgi:LPXTG-site transpeptidase (sortase) family protein
LNNGVSVSLQITATVVQAGSITNTAEVTDSDQPDPNSTPGNNDPTENDQASVTMGSIFDPPSAIKTFSAAGLPELEFRMVWINSGNAFAMNVQVVDQIPAGTVYVPGSLSCDPRGSSTNALVATSPLSLTAVPNSFCGYDAVANRIQWQGNMGPDDTHLTEATAVNEVVITFRVTVNNAVNQVRNQGFSRTDVDNDANFDEETVLGSSFVSSNQVVWNRNNPGSGSGDPDDDGGGITFPGLLPATGFAPNVITALPDQSTQKLYAATDAWVEIPSLGVSIPIVGVPLVNGDWDLSWLDKQVGWLNGTAFPSWKGNSALTGHVYLPNGKPGPFVGLGTLKWGDKIIVHAYGSVYTYEVRENRIINPTDTSILKHEDDAWLTLITCKTYNEATSTYSNRIAVRAALVSVQADKLQSIPKNAR